MWLYFSYYYPINSLIENLYYFQFIYMILITPYYLQNYKII